MGVGAGGWLAGLIGGAIVALVVHDDGDWSWALTLSGGRPVAVGTADTPAGIRVGVVRLESALIFGDGFERGDASAWTLP